MGRSFYLYPLKNGIYTAEILNPETGARVCFRSAGTKDRDKALITVAGWMRDGIPARRRGRRPARDVTGYITTPEAVTGLKGILAAVQKTELNPDDAMRIVEALKSRGLIDVAAVKNTGAGSAPFIKFLEKFWDYEKSEYIRDKLAHGHRFTRRHAVNCKYRIKELTGFFGGKKLNCVTAGDLKKLAAGLSGKGLATSTVNQYLLICSTALKWAFKEKMIPENPAAGMLKFSVTNKETGVLTEAEAAAVLSAVWKDRRAFAASLLSATTGARQGECLALRKADIGADTLNIARSYSVLDGEKLPKNNQKRTVPLLPEVRAALLGLLEENPHKGAENPFVFYSALPDKPVDSLVIYRGLMDVLKTAGIDRKARNICFHSWRHYYCSKITLILEREKAAKISGHLSESVFKKYEDHVEEKQIREAGEAAAEVFRNIIPFRQAV